MNFNMATGEKIFSKSTFSLYHESSLKCLDLSISSSLLLIDPLAPHGPKVQWHIYKISEKLRVLRLYFLLLGFESKKPFRLTHCLFKGQRIIVTCVPNQLVGFTIHIIGTGFREILPLWRGIVTFWLGLVVSKSTLFSSTCVSEDGTIVYHFSI